MRLQTKVTASVLLIAVTPLLLLAGLGYTSYRTDARASVLNHFRSVARIQQARLTTVLNQNRERLALVASRTQLRLSLDQYLRNGDPADLEIMRRILVDAAQSLADLLSITVYDTEGAVVTSTDPAQIGTTNDHPRLLDLARREPVVNYLEIGRTRQLHVDLAGPLQLDGRHLGVIVLTTAADNLLASLHDYAGLGHTGETLLVHPDASGTLVFLAPTRSDPAAALTPVPPALAGVLSENRSWSGVMDGTDGPTLFAQEPVPGTDWIVAVRMDDREALRRLRSTTQLAGGMGLLLVAGIVVAAAGFGRRVSAPLSELAQAAGTVSSGKFDVQVPVRSQDEIGTLEEGFNDMVQQIAQGRQRLEERIAELNQALSEIKTLKGIIPICASCKKIRDDDGYWAQLEAYLLEHSEAMFSHGLCPECVAELYPDEASETDE